MADQLRAAHLLVKFCNSRNPVSRRTGASTASVTYEAALEEISHWQRAIQEGKMTFEDAARQRSDCGSFAKGGDLGFFGPGEMMAPFEAAVRGLCVGQMSGVVQTDSGLHLIKRLA